MFGQEAVAERVDTMTAIMSQKLTCDDVVSMEFSYAPPVSQVTDPIAQAAAQILEKIDALKEQETEVEESSDEKIGEEKPVEEESKEEAIEESVEETVKEEVEEAAANEGSDETGSDGDKLSFTEYLRQQGFINQ